MNGRKTSPAGGDLLQALKGEPLSSGFSTKQTLISASAVPHCTVDVRGEGGGRMINPLLATTTTFSSSSFATKSGI